MASRLTETRLMNMALFRLAKGPRSVAAMRRSLGRRVTSLTRQGVTVDGDAAELVSRVLERLQRSGLLDDVRLATQKTESLRRRGSSRRRVEQKLRQAGLPRETVQEALAGDVTVDDDAVWRWAQRKRLGVFRDKDREGRRTKDLAALVRAGFGFRQAKEVVDATARPLV